MFDVTKDEVADLLENFVDFVNPDGVHDPWFEVTEINQQFAWDDVPLATLEGWLSELVAAGKVFTRIGPGGEREWRWLGHPTLDLDFSEGDG